MKRINTFGAILFVSLLSSPSWSTALEAAAHMDAVVERYWWYEFERTTSYFGAQVGVIGAIALSVIVLWLSKTIKTLSKHFRSKREHERVIIDRELHIKDTVTKNVSNIASKTADAPVKFIDIRDHPDFYMFEKKQYYLNEPKPPWFEGLSGYFLTCSIICVVLFFLHGCQF